MCCAPIAATAARRADVHRRVPERRARRARRDRAPAGRAVHGPLRPEGSTSQEDAPGGARRAPRRASPASTRTASCAASSRSSTRRCAPTRSLRSATACASSCARPTCRRCRRPTPLYEIFVYRPPIEGVHLRGGPVARGGIRWSDRREDYRTEILGLMKAQMVKNAVIVPVGAEGRLRAAQPADRARRADAPRSGAATRR